MAESSPCLMEDAYDMSPQCGICKGAYKSPRMLPCIHSFCQPCLESIAGDSCLNQHFSCPSCEEIVTIPANGVKDLPRNTLMMSPLDRLGLESTSGSESSTCYYCEGNQHIQLCLDCRSYICLHCRSLHNRIFDCSDHLFIPPETLRDEEYMKDVLAMQSLKCTEHPKEKLFLFCSSCNKLVCRDCVVSSHQRHGYVPAEEKCNVICQRLQIALNNSQTKCKSVSEISTSKQKVDEYVNEAELKIKECYNTLVARLASDKKELMEEIQQIKTEQMGQWKELSDRVTKWQGVMKNTQAVTKKILDVNNKWDILAMGSHIIAAFDKLCDEEDTMKKEHPIVLKNTISGIKVSERNLKVSSSKTSTKLSLPKENILGKVTKVSYSSKKLQRRQTYVSEDPSDSEEDESDKR